MSWTCDLYVSEISSTRVTGALNTPSNAFGACFRHVSVRYMGVPILLDIDSVACPMRVRVARCRASIYSACLACLGRNTNVL